MRGQVSKHRDRPYQAGRSKQRRLRIVKDEADIGAYKTHGSSSACAGNFEEGFPTALPRGRSRATSSGVQVFSTALYCGQRRTINRDAILVGLPRGGLIRRSLFALTDRSIRCHRSARWRSRLPSSQLFSEPSWARRPRFWPWVDS
jgi:hypothetical protein